MNKEIYEKFIASGSKIIEVNDILTEAIASLKTDYNELKKISHGSENTENTEYVGKMIQELEVMLHNSYLARIILHDKILELCNIIRLEWELEKAQGSSM